MGAEALAAWRQDLTLRHEGEPRREFAPRRGARAADREGGGVVAAVQRSDSLGDRSAHLQTLCRDQKHSAGVAARSQEWSMSNICSEKVYILHKLTVVFVGFLRNMC